MVNALGWRQISVVLALLIGYAVIAGLRLRDRDNMALRRVGQAFLWATSWSGWVVVARLTGIL